MGLLGSLSSIGGGFGGLNALSGLLGNGQGGHLNSLFLQLQRQNALRQTQAQGYGLQSLRSLNSGYDQALAGVGAQGEASKLAIGQAGAQNQAAIGQNLASRGLANTTIGANVGGAAGGQTAQALASVDAAMAQARGNLLTQRGQAQAGGFSNLGSLALGQGASEMGLGQLAWNRMISQPSQYQQLLQLMGGVGGLLPLLGGGAGMGAGAMGSAAPLMGTGIY